MLKKSVVILILGAAMMTAAVPASAQMKIGYVDTQLIMSEYQPALDAQKQLETAQQTAMDESKRRQEELVSKNKKFQQQSLLLSDEKKQATEGELQALYQQLQQFGAQKEQDLANLQNELMKPIIESINEAIQVVGKEEGYDYILEAVNLLYADEKHELTKKIQEKLGKIVKK